MAIGDLTRKQKDELDKKLNGMLSEGLASCHSEHQRWEENGRYTRGEQWAKGDIARQKRRQRPVTTLNDVLKIVESISNREMVERFVPKVLGRSGDDGGVANVIDEACRWQRDEANSEHYESNAFHSAVMCGFGVLHKYWDPSANDGAGMIRDEDVPLSEMLWPSRAREINLSDRRWHARGKWVDVEEAESIWGSNPILRKKFRKYRKERDMQGRMIGPFPDINTKGLRRSTNQGFGWTSLRGGVWMNQATAEVMVVEVEWKELEYVWRASIPVRFREWYEFMAAGVPIEFPQPPAEDGTEQPPYVLTKYDYDAMSDAEREQIRAEVLAQSEDVTIETRGDLNAFLDQWQEAVGREFEAYVESARTTIRYAIKVDDEIVDYGTRPWGWSYYFLTGFRFESGEGASFYGVVDVVKGSQDYKNALVSNLLSIYMSSPKGAFFVAKSKMGNINDLADKLATPSGIVPVDDAVVANFEQFIKQIPQPNYPTGFDALLGIFNEGVLGALGMNSIQLGSQQDLRRVSGNVVQAANTASNVIVAPFFDSLRLARKQYGKCNIRFIHRMYDLEDILRVVGSDKLPDVSAIDPSAWDDILLYDVKVDESPSSATEQMEQVEALTATGQLGQMYERGDLPFEMLVKHFLPKLPESAKRDLLEGKRLVDQINALAAENEELKSVAAQASQQQGARQISAGTLGPPGQG